MYKCGGENVQLFNKNTITLTQKWQKINLLEDPGNRSRVVRKILQDGI
jgi:hypothetical protein